MSRLALSLLTVLVLASCSRVSEVTVSPPRPADAGGPADPVARGSVSVHIEAAGTDMPRDVRSTRFRVTELQFRSASGEWFRRLSNRTALSTGEAGRSVYPLVGTELPVGRYDSLAVYLADVYVEFGMNAGGPVELGRNPVILALALNPVATRRTTILLRYDPASAVRADTLSGRWRFTPTFVAVPDTTTAGIFD